MENKEQKIVKKHPFENLKYLNALISGKDINVIFNEIRNAKLMLDTFCKQIKEHISVSNINDLNVADTQSFESISTKPEVASPRVVQEPLANRTMATNTTPKKQNVQNKHNNVANNEQLKTRTSDNNIRAFDKNAKTYDNKGYNRQNAVNNNRDKTEAYGARSANTNSTYQGQAQKTNANSTQRYNTSFTPSQNRVQFTPKSDGRKPFEKPSYNRTSTHTTAPRPKTGNFVKPEPVQIIAPKSNTFGGNKSKTKFVDNEKKGLNLREKIRMGHIRFEEGDENGVIRLKNKKQKSFKKQEKIEITNAVITEDILTVKILSEKIGKPASDIIKKFLLLGLMYNINSVIDYSTAELVASEFGVKLEHKIDKTYEEKLTDMFSEDSVPSQDDDIFVKRPPVIAVMGHVDHGKTSLLDYIKKSHVTLGESGGITQHIGAYSIKVKNNDITFIDTPGHEAFSEMRIRGANVADIAILIVAADDGIKPQTVEAIKYIKQAQIPMIVAMNKIDKNETNTERIKQQLTEHDLLVEEWGGDVVCIPISAKTGEGIDKLLEMILLVADLNNIVANPDADAQGTCIESKVDTGRGIVATIIIKNGTLKVGDYLVCGMASGRVRALTDYLGNSVTSAGPSMAVSVLGLNNVPSAGEKAYAVDEKLAKNIISERSTKLQIEKIQQNTGTTLEDFLSQSADNAVKVLKLIVKSDVQGTNEALCSTLEKIKNEEVNVQVISSGVGVVNENDVLLARSSNALIIAFNTKLDNKARVLADKNDVEIKHYKIIYEAADYISEIIEKMKSPKYKESITGKVEVRQLFKISSLGVIAGSYVLEGYISRNSTVRVMRDGEVITTTTLDSLQHHKDETKQVKSGFECGIKLKGFNDIKVGDILVAYENVRIN